jgi:hypothetical protein
MKHLFFLPLLALISCSSLPQLYQSVDDIATDDAIQVIISREAINKKTNLTVAIDVVNPTAAAK